MLNNAHTWHECRSSDCNICEGGLSVCTVCSLLEGALTSECPGMNVYAEKSDEIYAGKLDYVGGEWKQQASPHSPAYYRNSQEGIKNGTP